MLKILGIFLVSIFLLTGCTNAVNIPMEKSSEIRKNIAVTEELKSKDSMLPITECWVADSDIRGTYKGACKDGKANGYGIAQARDIYIGMFKDGKKHGAGTYNWKGKYNSIAGSFYDGFWKNGKRHGQGKYSYSNGNLYEGEWKNGNKHGKGKYKWVAGSIYDGFWKNGKKHGQGKNLYTNGDIYDGLWKNGNKHGKGKYKYLNGDIYEGTWKNDNRDGKTKHTSAEGKVTEGNWKNDEKVTVPEKPNFPKSIYIKPSLLVKTSSGCGAINPVPAPKESIKWTGKCKNGYLHGFGTLTWYKNGIKGTSSKSYYKNGFELSSKSNQFGDHAIKTNKCFFVMPSSMSKKSQKLMSVKFKGGCEKNYQGVVDIYFDNKLFARYTGKLARGNQLADGGELEYFSGDIYKLGKNPFGTYMSSSMAREWYDGAHLIKKANSSNQKINDDNFNIKLGFNTRPTNVKQNNQQLIGFNIRTLKTSNDILLNYDIKPKNNHNLKSKNYTITLEIKIDYREDANVMGFNVGNKKVAYDYVTIKLSKNKNYRKTGKIKLRNLTTYQKTLGIGIKTSGIKPKVKIISID